MSCRDVIMRLCRAGWKHYEVGAEQLCQESNIIITTKDLKGICKSPKPSFLLKYFRKVIKKRSFYGQADRKGGEGGSP